MLQVTLLPTLVSPEWTSTAASHLNDLQASTCTAQLWQEAALLEQLIYKNINQHGNTRPFQRLLEVRRLLRLLKGTSAAEDAITALRDALTLCSRPTLTLHERNVPTADSTLHVLHQVLGACRVAESLTHSTLVAAFQFTTQLAQSFFMPLSLTCLAILGRVRALSAQLLIDLVRIYNCCIEVIVLLPLESIPSSRGSEDEDEGVVEGDDGGDEKTKNENKFSSRFAKMPQMLRCSWTDSKPTVIEVDSTSNGGGSDLKLIQRPQVMAAEGGEGGKKRKNTPNSAPDLAVIEDRGVAVSREQLLAELRQQNVIQDPATAAAQVTIIAAASAAPAYARTEVNLANTGTGGMMNLVKKKEEKPKKKMGPKITIIPEDGDNTGGGGGVGGGGGGGGGGDKKKKQSLGGFNKVSKPRLEPLPPRTTAFISVEGLQKKPKIEEKKKEGEDVAAVARPAALPQSPAAAIAPPPPAATSGNPPTEVKSWEDWLAPLGSNEKKTQQQHQQSKLGSGSKKKSRRR